MVPCISPKMVCHTHSKTGAWRGWYLAQALRLNRECYSKQVIMLGSKCGGITVCSGWPSIFGTFKRPVSHVFFECHPCPLSSELKSNFKLQQYKCILSCHFVCHISILHCRFQEFSAVFCVSSNICSVHKEEELVAFTSVS